MSDIVEQRINEVADQIANEGMIVRASRVREGAVEICRQRLEINRLRAALLSCPCPGDGWNGMPKDLEPTVKACVTHKICGCILGRALGAQIMSDIVERLRDRYDRCGTDGNLVHEAADEIERLREHIEALRLQAVADEREVERLQAALIDALTGINHVALYKADNWPDPGTDHMEALERIGAGQSYDLWCCWNAGMRARRALEQK